MHYNDDVLLPFIWSIRQQLGWKPGKKITEWMKEISWFDGNIPHLQTMMFKAREALDKSECIIQNKYLVPSTVTQQPCDLSPVFLF